MYLFVFIFVIMSILGLYTEMFSLRMVQYMAQQKGVGELVNTWHKGAVSLARDKAATIVIPAAGCSLGLATNGCVDGSGNAAYLMDAPGYTNATTYLPPGYQYVNVGMQFNSILYQTAGLHYIVTYIPPGENHLGFNPQQILKQMKNAGLSPMSYGSVGQNVPCNGTVGDYLVTAGYMTLSQPLVTTAQVCYPIPLAPTMIVPAGSVGIASYF